MDYRSEIDGLRALAVLPVILFHAHVPGFSGGYIGVDIFFVISGYLITTILISDIDNNKYSIVKFYERRLRRILPALSVMVMCCYPVAYFLLLPSEFWDFSQSILAVTAFASNVLFFLESDYFATASELKPLLHTWSLAIEEQYYIFFPIFLTLFWRYSKHIVLLLMTVIFLVSFGISVWAATRYPSANFYLLPSRVWELLIGAFLAFIIYYRGYYQNTLLNQVGAFAGLLAIIYSVVFFDSNTPFPSAYTLVPTLGAAALIMFATNGTYIQRLLRFQPFVYIGLISYSLYLWHQPIFAFVKQYYFFEAPTTVVMLALSTLTLGVAHLSWKFVETPFRSKQRFDRNRIFKWSAAVTILLVALGITGMFISTEKPTPVFLSKYQLEHFTFDNAQLREQSWQPLRELSGNSRYQVDNNDFDQKLWFDELDPRHKLLIIGNSHSKDIFNVLSASKQANTHFQIARYGQQISKLTPKLFDLPNYKSAQVIMLASQYRNDKLKIDWLVQATKNQGKVLVIVRNITEFQQYYARSLTLADKTIRELVESGESDPLILRDAVNLRYQNHFLERNTHPHIDASNEKITQLQSQHPDIVVLDRNNYICGYENQQCIFIDSYLNKFFYDYGHHTLQGAEFYAKRVDELNWLTALIKQVDNKP